MSSVELQNLLFPWPNALKDQGLIWISIWDWHLRARDCYHSMPYWSHPGRKWSPLSSCSWISSEFQALYPASSEACKAKFFVKRLLDWACYVESCQEDTYYRRRSLIWYLGHISQRNTGNSDLHIELLSWYLWSSVREWDRTYRMDSQDHRTSHLLSVGFCLVLCNSRILGWSSWKRSFSFSISGGTLDLWDWDSPSLPQRSCRILRCRMGCWEVVVWCLQFDHRRRCFLSGIHLPCEARESEYHRIGPARPSSFELCHPCLSSRTRCSDLDTEPITSVRSAKASAASGTTDQTPQSWHHCDRCSRALDQTVICNCHYWPASSIDYCQNHTHYTSDSYSIIVAIITAYSTIAKLFTWPIH